MSLGERVQGREDYICSGAYTSQVPVVVSSHSSLIGGMQSALAALPRIARTARPRAFPSAAPGPRAVAGLYDARNGVASHTDHRVSRCATCWRRAVAATCSGPQTLLNGGAYANVELWRFVKGKASEERGGYHVNPLRHTRATHHLRATEPAGAPVGDEFHGQRLRITIIRCPVSGLASANSPQHTS